MPPTGDSTSKKRQRSADDDEEEDFEDEEEEEEDDDDGVGMVDMEPRVESGGSWCRSYYTPGVHEGREGYWCDLCVAAHTGPGKPKKAWKPKDKSASTGNRIKHLRRYHPEVCPEPGKGAQKDTPGMFCALYMLYMLGNMCLTVPMQP